MGRQFSGSVHRIFIEHLNGGGLPVVCIPGGYHSTTHYCTTPDDRPGWAQLLKDAGFNVFVCDLPDRGQSGHVSFDQLSGKFAVEAYKEIILSIGKPVVLMTHSLSGPWGCKLVELLPKNILVHITVEPAQLGNIQQVSTIDENNEILFKGLHLHVPNKYTPPPDTFIERWTTTKQFPIEAKQQYVSSLQAIHPQFLLERLNVDSMQVKITEQAYPKTPQLVLTSPSDLFHIEEDAKVVQFLKKSGAKAQHWELNKQNIHGNGHLMMLEKNNEGIAEKIVRWIREHVN